MTWIPSDDDYTGPRYRVQFTRDSHSVLYAHLHPAYYNFIHNLPPFIQEDVARRAAVRLADIRWELENQNRDEWAYRKRMLRYSGPYRHVDRADYGPTDPSAVPFHRVAALLREPPKMFREDIHPPQDFYN